MNAATVRVPVATLWTSPDRVRPVDKLAFHGDVRTWVATMTLAERDDLNDRTESQLLLGEQVVVEEVTGEYGRVVAVAQPAPRNDPRGYAGWINVDHLNEIDAITLAAPTHVVVVPHTSILDRPRGGVLHSGVILGTEVTVTGSPVDGHLPLIGTGYIPSHAVAVVPTRPPSGAELLSTASLLRGCPYVWGGMSPFGIDCSGLVHLTCRRLGVTVPRNASDQFDTTTPLDFGEERPGDVYFFQRPGRPVHHVGFVAAPPDPDGTRHVLHACATRRGVVREPMTSERRDTLIGVHRLV